MTIRHEHTLAGYARATVDLKTRMHEYCQGIVAAEHVHGFIDCRWPATATTRPARPAGLGDAINRLHRMVWAGGEPFVLAPAMTAIVAAAAQGLRLGGDTVPDDVAPCAAGVLVLPEPIYYRSLDGGLANIGALTWAPYTTSDGRAWLITGWSDRDEPGDPSLDGILGDDPADRAALPPYLLTEIVHLPIDRPVTQRPDPPDLDETDLHWQSAPDGRYVITQADADTNVCTAIAYAFWRIQAQPLATVAAAPLDRAARRRAARASIRHDTRVVMLRRTSPLAEPGDSEAKWHYRVRFVVRGHWRRLIDRDGRPYRIWINAHIKGPDGAPLLHGEKVAVLAR